MSALTLPKQRASPALTTSPFTARKAWGCPQVPPHSPACWCHRLLEAQGSLQDLPPPGTSSHPQQLQRITKGQTTDFFPVPPDIG